MVFTLLRSNDDMIHKLVLVIQTKKHTERVSLSSSCLLGGPPFLSVYTALPSSEVSAALLTSSPDDANARPSGVQLVGEQREKLRTKQ